MKTIKKQFKLAFSLALTSGLSIAQTNNPFPYCSADLGPKVHTMESSSITGLNIGTLNNVSTFYDNSSKYNFYNNLVAPNLLTGSQQTLTVTFGAAVDAEPSYFSAYIDFNNNSAFESNELIMCNANTINARLGYNTIQTVSKVFTIPLNATTGTTRLRVLRGLNTSSPSGPLGAYAPTYTLSACLPITTFYFGEIEDYEINITNSVTGLFSNVQSTESVKIYPSITENKFYVDFVKAYKSLTVKIYNSVGSMINEKTLSSSGEIDVLDFTNGMYYLKIMDENDLILTKTIIKI